MSKFCNYCGAEADDNASFCAVCGSSFSPTSKLSQPEQPYEQNQYNDNFDNPYEQKPYQYQPVSYVTAPPVKQAKPGKGFGIASMVLGIVAADCAIGLLILSLIMGAINSDYSINLTDKYFGELIFGIVGIVLIAFTAVLIILSLIFGIISVVKGKRVTAIVGLVLSGLSIAACVFFVVTLNNLNLPSTGDYISHNINDYGSSFESSLDDFESKMNDFENYFD